MVLKRVDLAYQKWLSRSVACYETSTWPQRECTASLECRCFSLSVYSCDLKLSGKPCSREGEGRGGVSPDRRLDMTMKLRSCRKLLPLLAGQLKAPARHFLFFYVVNYPENHRRNVSNETSHLNFCRCFFLKLFTEHKVIEVEENMQKNSFLNWSNECNLFFSLLDFSFPFRISALAITFLKEINHKCNPQPQTHRFILNLSDNHISLCQSLCLSVSSWLNQNCKHLTENAPVIPAANRNLQTREHISYKPLAHSPVNAAFLWDQKDWWSLS